MKKFTSFILVAMLLLAVTFCGCGGGSGGGGTKSNNANLSALTVSSGSLVPEFDPAITSYTVSVAITSVMVTGTKADANASVSGPVTLENLEEGEAQTATIAVTAQNGVTKTYTVKVTRVGSSTRAITAFNFVDPPVTGDIIEANHTIAVTVPYGTNVTALTPMIGHTGASVDPASGVPQNFTNPVTYTVRAGDGSTQVYTVTVTKEPNSGGSGIESFTHTVEGVNFDVRRVPGGLTFPTDSAVLAFDDSSTATVANTYWIAETEVTYELWYKVYVWAVGHGYKFDHLEYYPTEGSSGAKVSLTGSPQVPTEPPANKKLEPVTRVCWRDAIVWCNALSELAGFSVVYKNGEEVVKDATIYTDFNDLSAPAVGDKGFRLPSSKEWELAARYKGNDSSNGAIEKGGLYWTPGTYASGATEYAANKLGVINPNQNPTKAVAVYNTSCTAQVHSKDTNALGLYDMSGNVWEWCFDWCSSTKRVARGGAWDYDASDQRLGYVYGNQPSTYSSIIGFRIVRTD